MCEIIEAGQRIFGSERRQSREDVRVVVVEDRHIEGAIGHRSTAEGEVSRAAQNEISLEGAVRDLADGDDRGRERRIRAEQVEGCGDREDLRRGPGEELLVGVDGDEGLAAVDVDHRHPPAAALGGGLVHDGRDRGWHISGRTGRGGGARDQSR